VYGRCGRVQASLVLRIRCARAFPRPCGAVRWPASPSAWSLATVSLHTTISFFFVFFFFSSSSSSSFVIDDNRHYDCEENRGAVRHLHAGQRRRGNRGTRVRQAHRYEMSLFPFTPVFSSVIGWLVDGDCRVVHRTANRCADSASASDRAVFSHRQIQSREEVSHSLAHVHFFHTLLAVLIDEFV
jgi:hypothetical protein